MSPWTAPRHMAEEVGDRIDGGGSSELLLAVGLKTGAAGFFFFFFLQQLHTDVENRSRTRPLL